MALVDAARSTVCNRCIYLAVTTTVGSKYVQYMCSRVLLIVTNFPCASNGIGAQGLSSLTWATGWLNAIAADLSSATWCTGDCYLSSFIMLLGLIISQKNDAATVVEAGKYVPF